MNLEMCDRGPNKLPSMRDLDDAQLLDLWRTGAPKAGDLLCERYYLAVFKFFERRAPEDAYDLTQRAFAKCCSSLDRIRLGGSFRPYIFQIANREFADHLRRLQRIRGRAADADVDTLLSLGVSPSKAAATNEDIQRLASALYELPIAVQSVIELHYFEGMTTDEIAVALDMPVGSVRTRLRTGRTCLAELIGARAGFGARVEVATIDGWLAELRRSR